jgi:serine/threonine protein kinase
MAPARGDASLLTKEAAGEDEEEVEEEENSHELSLSDSLLLPKHSNLRIRLAVALHHRSRHHNSLVEPKGSVATVASSDMESAAAAVAAEDDDYEYYDSDSKDGAPKFAPEELVLGKFLGRGGFSNVLEVRAMKLVEPEPESQAEASPRQFLARHCTRENGDARYAVKRVRRSHGDGVNKEGDDEDQKSSEKEDAKRRRERVGMLDLATEAQFLRRLEHPNIIKLRGVSTAEPFSAGYFLVLDRLYDTLADRLRSWKDQTRKLGGGAGKFGSWVGEPKRSPFLEGAKQLLRRRSSTTSEVEEATKSVARNLLMARLGAAHDLAFAIEYLHERRIIHRDIKPANVGFDVRGDVKIFDFGMARELPPPKDSDIGQADGLYSGLSHMTGSLRFMSPEVALGRPYNAGCDVYSLSLVVWEMLALRRPYGHCNDLQTFKTKVFERGHRPALPPGWPDRIRESLAASWVEDPRMRADVRLLGDGLRSELVRLRNGDDHGLVGEDRWRRRSTYVYAPSQRKTVKGATVVSSK